MTSLGGPVEVWYLGIAIATGAGGRNRAEGGTGMSPESLFYLACDGEIQINSCQSGGSQGEGPQWWGWMDGGKMVEGRGGGCGTGDGLTDEVSTLGFATGLSHHFLDHTEH